MELVRIQLPKHLLLLAGMTGLILTIVTYVTTTFLPSLPSPSPPNTSGPPNIPPHPELADSHSPELRKLAEYEKKYGPITDQLMIFSDTPTSTTEAKTWAISMAAKLKEFAAHSIKPLVVFEPTGETVPLKFEKYREGAYDTFLRTYFSALKAKGITDETIGTWVFFPEANTPAWENSTEPSLIAACITRTVKQYKQSFPEGKATLLLDSKSYPSYDKLWEHGEHKSLTPYLTELPEGLVDSFGLQGFPWAPPANESSPRLFDPHKFVDAKRAVEAATVLKVEQIWFNSGTFGKAHADNPREVVTISPSERARLLQGTVDELEKATWAGYDVSINLFSADKTATTEATDWSYEQSPEDQQLFKTVVKNIKEKNMSLSLYDSLYPY